MRTNYSRDAKSASPYGRPQSTGALPSSGGHVRTLGFSDTDDFDKDVGPSKSDANARTPEPFVLSDKGIVTLVSVTTRSPVTVVFFLFFSFFLHL